MIINLSISLLLIILFFILPLSKLLTLGDTAYVGVVAKEVLGLVLLLELSKEEGLSPLSTSLRLPLRVMPALRSHLRLITYDCPKDASFASCP